MVQARLMWSFHCFSDMLLYLDLQLAMLVSSDGSVAMASSGVDSGLYHIVSRSISLACGDTRHGEGQGLTSEQEICIKRKRWCQYQHGQQERPTFHVVLVQLGASVALLG